MASVSKREWTYNGETKTAWAVRFVDEKGVRRSKQFDKKKDADAFKRKVEREAEDGTFVADADTQTVEASCEDFVRHMEDRRRMGAIGRNREVSVALHIDRSIIPHLGAMKWTELKPVRVEQWTREMVRLDGLNPRTARDRLSTFRLVEKFAMAHGRLRKRVSDHAVEAMRGIARAKVRTFTANQIQHLLGVVETRAAHKWRNDSMMRCFVYLAATCGLRFGEIVGLTVPLIDFDRRMIRVRHSLTQWDELKGPKTAAGTRDVPMPAHVAQALKTWLERWYQHNDRQIVFRTVQGGRVMGDNLQEMWTALLKRAGIADEGQSYHFHALRHFAASWWIENGLSLMDVAQLMGHEKFDMTLQTYAHPVSDRAAHHLAFERMSMGLRTAGPMLDGALLTQGASQIDGSLTQG